MDTDVMMDTGAVMDTNLSARLMNSDRADHAADRAVLLAYFNPSGPPPTGDPQHVAPPPGHPWSVYGPLAGLDEQDPQVRSALVTEHDCPRCRGTGIEPAALWAAAEAPCTLCLGTGRVGQLRLDAEALQALGPLLVASLNETIQTAVSVCLEIPLIRLDPKDPLTILAPLLEYHRLDGRRRIEGWTIGALHPLAVVSPNSVMGVLPREGRTLWLAEGVLPRALDGVKRRECRRTQREARRDGWAGLRIENVDRSGEDLLDTISEKRILGNAAFGLDTLGLDIEAKELGAFSGGSPHRQAGFLANAALISGPWRHELLAARVAAEVQRPRRAHRIVLPWGILHAGGLERDVWTPNGFHLFRVSWWRAARLEWPL